MFSVGEVGEVQSVSPPSAAIIWAEFTLFGDHGQYWSLFEWEYDGHTKAIGEGQEYKCLDEWRRWHRARPEAWALR